QTERALENLKAVLAASGSDMSKVVKTTVYLVSMEDFGAMNKVYGRFFSGEATPARSTVGINQLPRNALVEIDCVAIAGLRAHERRRARPRREAGAPRRATVSRAGARRRVRAAHA